MDGFSTSLLLAAAGVGAVHTLLGPDHYLPFLMIARARRWSWARTLATAGACGVAHVLASLAAGLIGLALGAGVGRIEALETGRGDWAAWLLVAFGLAYGVWGTRTALRRSADLQPHEHAGRVHIHRHGTQRHRHATIDAGGSASFWALLLVFVLGPCEPLIPLFVLPASRGRWELALAAAAVFGVVTVLTMMAATAFGLAALRPLPLGPLERWVHTLAGAMIAASGLAVVALGL